MRVSVTAPEGFAVVEPPAGVAWAAALEGDAPFRANLTLTLEDLPAGVEGAAALTDAALEVQDRALVAHRLIDRESTDLGGHEATRTLSHHVVGPAAVTIEQWRVAALGVGVTLTASCATLDLPGLAPEFQAAADTLEVRA